MASKTKLAKKEPSKSGSDVAEERATDKTEAGIDEGELERLALEALLDEAKRSKVRAEQVGALGWQKCRVPRANKRFLNNLVMSDVTSNKRMRVSPCSASQKNSRHEDRRVSSDSSHKESRHSSASRSREEHSHTQSKHLSRSPQARTRDTQPHH